MCMLEPPIEPPTFVGKVVQLCVSRGGGGVGWGGGIVLCESPVRGEDVGVGLMLTSQKRGLSVTTTIDINFLSIQLIKFCSPQPLLDPPLIHSHQSPQDHSPSYSIPLPTSSIAKWCEEEG